MQSEASTVLTLSSSMSSTGSGHEEIDGANSYFLIYSFLLSPLLTTYYSLDSGHRTFTIGLQQHRSIAII